MLPIEILITALLAGYGGMCIGAWGEARAWRLKADMGLRKASGDRLFTVHEEGEIERMVDNVLNQAAIICEVQANEWESPGVVTNKNYARSCAFQIRHLKKRFYMSEGKLRLADKPMREAKPPASGSGVPVPNRCCSGK